MENLNIIRFGIIFVLVFCEFKVLLCFGCDFDRDFCDWSHDETNTLTWTRQNGTTPSSHTGPESDHTTGDGHYIYTEASDTQGHEEKARLISPVLESGPFCLIFWYSMYGQNIGSLHVYRRTNTSSDLLLAKSESMNTGKWMKAVISKIAPVDYQIVLEATVSGVKGDIAVDDISLNLGMCSADCSFETGFCNWDQDKNDNFDWLRQMGETQTPFTGPLADHTSGDQDGSYIYIDAGYPREYEHKARLISPIQEPGSYCLVFWYCMYGVHINKFNVYIKIDSCTDTLLFSKENDTKSMDWRNSEISFKSAFEYQTIFEGVTGKGVQGDIAIDDVLLKAELCHNDEAVKVVTQLSCQTQPTKTKFTLETTTMAVETRLSTIVNSTTSPTKNTRAETNQPVTTFIVSTESPGGNLSSTITKDLKKTSNRVIYIPLITAITILVIVLILCIFIWRKWRLKCTTVLGFRLGRNKNPVIQESMELSNAANNYEHMNSNAMQTATVGSTLPDNEYAVLSNTENDEVVHVYSNNAEAKIEDKSSDNLGYENAGNFALPFGCVAENANAAKPIQLYECLKTDAQNEKDSYDLLNTN